MDPEMMSTMPKGLTAATGMDALTHPLGALYDTPHGIANAIILPTVMEYNAEATGEKYREIARAMGVAGVDSMSQEEYRKAAVDAVKKLSEDVGIPGDLKEIVKREDIPFLAQSAYDDACRPGNPKETSVEDITKPYPILVPHWPQNFIPAGTSAPQLGQRGLGGAKGAPHWPQNFIPTGTAQLQLGQMTVEASPEGGALRGCGDENMAFTMFPMAEPRPRPMPAPIIAPPIPPFSTALFKISAFSCRAQPLLPSWSRICIRS